MQLLLNRIIAVWTAPLPPTVLRLPLDLAGEARLKFERAISECTREKFIRSEAIGGNESAFFIFLDNLNIPFSFLFFLFYFSFLLP